MEQKQKDALWAQYTKQTHRLGRVLSLITVALLLGAPFVIGTLLGAYPDLGATARGFLSVGLVWTVSSVAEFLIYTPMLGAGGGYLAFITGNLINMKIPCAVNARDLAGVRTGTPENEIVSTLSIATSSLVTIVILALGVLALQLLATPATQPDDLARILGAASLPAGALMPATANPADHTPRKSATPSPTRDMTTHAIAHRAKPRSVGSGSSSPESLSSRSAAVLYVAAATVRGDWRRFTSPSATKKTDCAVR